MKHVMIDLETGATTPDALILTLGAVSFDPRGDVRKYKDKSNVLYLKITIDDQKRHIDEDTMHWWSKQKPAVIKEALEDEGDRINLKDALLLLDRFFSGHKYIWSHGSVFDVVILENAYAQNNLVPPWKFWNIRDTRTLFDLGHTPDMPKEGMHNSMLDAIRQAIGVQNIYKKMEI